jgi:hypothetical protein
MSTSADDTNESALSGAATGWNSQCNYGGVPSGNEYAFGRAEPRGRLNPPQSTGKREQRTSRFPVGSLVVGSFCKRIDDGGRIEAMWKHAVVVLSLTLVGLAFGVSEVEACSCVIGSGAPAGLSREEQSEHYRKSYREHVRQQFGEAYAIFSAEAIAVGRDTVTFRLDDVWKGELPRELSMAAAPDPNVYPTASISSCDYFFKAGTRYLIFAYGSSVATMKTEPCTPTGELAIDFAGGADVRIWTMETLDELVPVRSKPKG